MKKLLTVKLKDLFLRIDKPPNPGLQLASSPPRLRKRRGKKRKKEGDTWDLTKQRVRVLAKGRCHRGVHSRLPITRRQLWSSVVPALIIIVLHIQVDKLGVVYTECTASIVYVLTIECLRESTKIAYIFKYLVQHCTNLRTESTFCHKQIQHPPLWLVEHSLHHCIVARPETDCSL